MSSSLVPVLRCLAAWLALAAAGSTGAAAVPSAVAVGLPGLRVSADPALPVAGRPLRLALDFHAAGDPGWCGWRPAEGAAGPALAFEQGTLVLRVERPAPPPSCEGSSPATLDFVVPGEEIAAGLLPVEVRHVVGFLQEETLARAGVEVQPDGPALGLHGGRFRLALSWVDPADGGLRTASAVRYSEESGAFWFLDPANPEVLVKLLDGGEINGHYWLFAASLTELAFTLEILDSAGGCLDLPVHPPACPTRVYHHPAGASRNFEDVEAMAAAAPPEPPAPRTGPDELVLDPALPHRGEPLRLLSTLGADPDGWCRVGQGGVAVDADAAVLYLLVEDLWPPILPPPCPEPPPGLAPFAWEIDTGELPAGRPNWRVAMVWSGLPPEVQQPLAETAFELREATAPGAPPAPLVLHPALPPAERFSARVDWANPATGETGQGRPTRLSSDSGQFTFFGPGNVEVALKLLDGRAVNGHWWLFVSSQTRLPYTLRVARGAGCAAPVAPGPGCEVVTFEHPEGPPANRVDIEAFAAEAP